MASPFKLHVYRSAREFLESQPDGLDSSEMNLILGSARDAAKKPQVPTIWIIISAQDVTKESDDNAKTPNMDQITENSIILAIGSPTMETYFISKPSYVSITEALLVNIFSTAVTALLENQILQIHSVFGPKSLTDPLLSEWGSRQQLPLETRPDASVSSTLAVIRSLPIKEPETQKTRLEPPVIFTAADLVTIEANEQEIGKIKEELVECFVDFLGEASEETRGTAQKWVEDVSTQKEKGRIYIAMATNSGSPHNVFGILFLGRETGNTMSIRCVYTRPSFRGNGVAEELVRASTRWWLQQEAEDKKKREVTLFVDPANVAAVKVYTKCGFQLGEEIWERRGFVGVSLGNF